MRPGGKILYPASLYHFERVICAVSEREHLDQTGSTHYLVILIYHYHLKSAVFAPVFERGIFAEDEHRRNVDQPLTEDVENLSRKETATISRYFGRKLALWTIPCYRLT